MLPALLVRFRPTGPWRFGPDSGARNRVDPVCHSDTFFSAVTSAISQLDSIEPWLEATVGTAAVRLSSLFPWQGDMLFVPAPKGLWPPPASSRVRWGGARFIPSRVLELMLAGKTIEEDRWLVDGPSACLAPSGGRFRGTGPFREGLRTGAAVDRWNGGAEPYRTACLEFAEDAGMWGLAVFRDETARASWSGPLRAAFRLLADHGIGGERSLGWGRSAEPQFREGLLSELLFRHPVEHAEPPNARWLLSLYRPAPGDAVDWSLGSYSVVTRTGRTWSPARSGDLKRSVRMVSEGSVLVSSMELSGSACDVAPPGFPHPVWAAGFAVSLPVIWKKPVPASLPPLETAPAPVPAPPEPAAEPAPSVVEQPEEAQPETPMESAPEAQQPAVEPDRSAGELALQAAPEECPAPPEALEAQFEPPPAEAESAEPVEPAGEPSGEPQEPSSETPSGDSEEPGKTPEVAP